MMDFSAMELVQLGLGLAGLALLWRLVLAPAARAQPAVAGLARWEIPPLDFALHAWSVLAAGIFAQLAAGTAATSAGLTGDAYLVAAAPAMPAGMLLACAVLQRRARAAGGAALFGGGFGRAGAATFMVALPPMMGVAVGWVWLLEAVGLPAERQEVVDGFLRMESPVLRAGLALHAIVLAPLAEEWVFRGVLFRFARGRLPRWGALLLPAAVWAALHGLTAFAPLLALGVVLSLAYERTGNLAVPVFAHALFNLNTISLLLAGAAG
jgi:membrane protease YdiL (CAAX protease family)